MIELLEQLKGLLGDLIEVVWPKKWCLVTETVTGTLLVRSMHRTSADALFAIDDPMSDRVLHLDDLYGNIYFIGESP